MCIRDSLQALILICTSQSHLSKPRVIAFYHICEKLSHTNPALAKMMTTGRFWYNVFLKVHNFQSLSLCINQIAQVVSWYEYFESTWNGAAVIHPPQLITLTKANWSYNFFLSVFEPFFWGSQYQPRTCQMPKPRTIYKSATTNLNCFWLAVLATHGSSGAFACQLWKAFFH